MRILRKKDAKELGKRWRRHRALSKGRSGGHEESIPTTTTTQAVKKRKARFKEEANCAKPSTCAGRGKVKISGAPPHAARGRKKRRIGEGEGTNRAVI